MQVVKNISMKTPQDPLIEAAFETFSRYGVRKTTMADIAQAAGVSRQTLYNRFANKDEVLRGAVNYLALHRLETMQSDWAQTSDLGSKIEVFFSAAPIFWYDLIRQTPDAADLVEGLHIAAKSELDLAHERWKAALAGMLHPFHNRTGAAGPQTEALADFLYSAAYTAKIDAADRDQLLQRLAVLKAAVLALLGKA